MFFPPRETTQIRREEEKAKKLVSPEKNKTGVGGGDQEKERGGANLFDRCFAKNLEGFFSAKKKFVPTASGKTFPPFFHHEFACK